MTTLTYAERTPRLPHLRAYLAGVGATTALTAGALVVFLSLAAFLAFEGLPFGGPSDDAGAAYLGPSINTPPGDAAAALAAAPNAVARAAAGSSHPAIAPAGSGGGPSAGNPTAPGHSSGVPPSAKSPASIPSLPTPPRDAASPPGDVPSLPSNPGPVTDAVKDVDNAAGTDLSGPTGGVTGAVDGAATGALNHAGGVVGHPDLGDQVGGAVSGVTDRALGGRLGPTGIGLRAK